MAVKRPVRDAWWRVRGMSIAKASLPAEPRSLLFICKGNICRSPFAERYAAQLLNQAGERGVRCQSAGFAVSREHASPAVAVAAAPAFGVSLETHRASPLTSEMMDQADLIVVTEVAHVGLLRRRYPNAGGRICPAAVVRPGARGARWLRALQHRGSGTASCPRSSPRATPGSHKASRICSGSFDRRSRRVTNDEGRIVPPATPAQGALGPTGPAEAGHDADELRPGFALVRQKPDTTPDGRTRT